MYEPRSGINGLTASASVGQIPHRVISVNSSRAFRENTNKLKNIQRRVSMVMSVQEEVQRQKPDHA